MNTTIKQTDSRVRHSRGMASASRKAGFKAPLWLLTHGTLDRLAYAVRPWQTRINGPLGFLP